MLFESLPGVYRFNHSKHPKRGKYENRIFTESLSKYPEVLWAKQLSHRRWELKSVKCPGMIFYGTATYKNALSDALFNSQWYLHECRVNAQFPSYDLNVFPVWYLHNIFGRDVVVLVVDDGVEIDHLDLVDNYDDFFGLDLVEGGDVPVPRQFMSRKFAHGTKCAGVIAMRADNNICGAGIAPLATFGAVRLIGPVAQTDYEDSVALSFRFKDVDIMSNSWGAPDDGKGMAPMAELTRTEIKRGIEQGRGGRGIIYVFPAGNGKEKNDSCGADQFVNSIFTVVIGGVQFEGQVTLYSERCAGIMGVVYSGSSVSKFNIVTTYINNKCVENFSGTSAAVPIASGIFALLLEANYKITWRGIQHAIAYTGEVAPLADSPGWMRNGAGFYVGHNFGFGMLDARRMVEFVKTMEESVPPMNSCVVRPELNDEPTFSRRTVTHISFATDGCQSLPSEINYIEHVQLMVSAQYTKRGAIKINLRSPSGTLSHMLESRKLDKSKDGLKGWIMDTVLLWGESPRGEWRVTFMDVTGWDSFIGHVQSITLIIYGTKNMPSHYKNRRTYYRFMATIKKSELVFFFK